MKLPVVNEVLQDDTHRLIPAKYTDQDETVLTRLTKDAGDLNALYELEGATNDRLLGETGMLPGISVRELVFGIPYAHIINASYTHPNPLGGRFNGAARGAWYAGFSRATSEREVAYHRGKELQEVRWEEPESFLYVDFLADFRGGFHDIRGEKQFADCLDPDSYKASQRLGEVLLDGGSAGVVFPSVRHKGGTCIACFRPALVNNVRKGPTVSIAFENAFAAAEIREVE
jgi:hypothetical protein